VIAAKSVSQLGPNPSNIASKNGMVNNSLRRVLQQNISPLPMFSAQQNSFDCA
jgi:hypothetical protein